MEESLCFGTRNIQRVLLIAQTALHLSRNINLPVTGRATGKNHMAAWAAVCTPPSSILGPKPDDEIGVRNKRCHSSLLVPPSLPSGGLADETVIFSSLLFNRMSLTDITLVNSQRTTSTFLTLLHSHARGHLEKNSILGRSQSLRPRILRQTARLFGGSFLLGNRVSCRKMSSRSSWLQAAAEGFGSRSDSCEERRTDTMVHLAGPTSEFCVSDRTAQPGTA